MTCPDCLIVVGVVCSARGCEAKSCASLPHLGHLGTLGFWLITHHLPIGIRGGFAEREERREDRESLSLLLSPLAGRQVTGDGPIGFSRPKPLSRPQALDVNLAQWARSKQISVDAWIVAHGYSSTSRIFTDSIGTSSNSANKRRASSPSVAMGNT